MALLPYAWAPIYSFPPPRPFSGSQLWNPYAERTGAWQRANFHAHSRAWGGFTSGAQPADEVVARYRSLGYSVAGVSNYQWIAAQHGVDTMPLYEHGFNLGKNHQLAIGAHAVDWFDLPLWQSVSNQQYVIDRVRNKADLVSLNHPSSRDAYDVDAMRALTGYQLIEIANGPFTVEDVWDAALTAGRPVWAVANDDTHDLRDTRRTAAAWTMVDARSAATGDIVSALRLGRAYAVLRTGGSIASANATTLASVDVQDATVRVSVDGSPSTFTFIGPDGAVRHVEKDVTSAHYTLGPADSYVRTVITAPEATLFLNPVVRWDGRSLPSPTATLNAAATWAQRGGALALLVLAWVKRRGRRGSAALAATPLTRRA
ncbi:MAG: hypothetical protein JSU08_11865 [Acidobacteria bacterium]|nr:hypothetical protein [Acidobacteriota bacterium]